ncbi:hypothetical protein GCK72_004944 [Caenorhabditis remanei]|uniref:Uncharacterized protein n=1 Tax=Caenorhabditis remanei TaxID=31234 RepID=A0A6A5HF54_CAERE|nr:hypothetical protein GCK72_004944 [Caenorhabditis remanei]KAF1764993.1 hypothetical protein GCK72_004944 [Caenorhabditis remanei]
MKSRQNIYGKAERRKEPENEITVGWEWKEGCDERLKRQNSLIDILKVLNVCIERVFSSELTDLGVESVTDEFDERTDEKSPCPTGLFTLFHSILFQNHFDHYLLETVPFLSAETVFVFQVDVVCTDLAEELGVLKKIKKLD